tara:strand:- start:367 stop:1155 length:789 start_codon:yes stop_codon:yes gene_type:complete
MMYARPGWCDLTADVDFSHLAAVGEAHGLRTVLFAPQTALEQTALEQTAPEAKTSGEAASPLLSDETSVGLGTHSELAAYSSSLPRAICEAWYSLGSFMMLVQASGTLASGTLAGGFTEGLREGLREGWSPPTTSFPLFACMGFPSMLMLSLGATLRTLGRIVLDVALEFERSSPMQTGPSERELAAALANARLMTVPCFRPHWRRMVKEVVHILDPSKPAPPKPQLTLHLMARVLLQRDLQLVRGGVHRDHTLLQGGVASV